MKLHLLKLSQSDVVGASASTLCLLHCVATPLLFMASTCSAACNTNAPFWWQSIDFIFIVISALAVYWSARNTNIRWMNYSLWFFWALLTTTIINEKLSLISIPESTIYIPAVALVMLHLFNRKYCSCNDGKCCSKIQNHKTKMS